MSYNWTTRIYYNTGTITIPVWTLLTILDTTPTSDSMDPEINIAKYKRIDGLSLAHVAPEKVSNHSRSMNFYCTVEKWVVWRGLKGYQIKVEERMWVDKYKTSYMLETSIGLVEAISETRIAKTVPQRFELGVTFFVLSNTLGTLVVLT